MPSDWTAACLAGDLPPGVVMQSECGGVEVAIWRSASGKVSAWRDRCQHRGMRLSHGFVRGETLSCIYHGWVYGTDGGCRRIPAHPDLVPPAAIRAVALQCVEAHGLIWAAPTGAAGLPPDLGGPLPVRSIVVDASGRHLEGLLRPAFQSSDGQILRGSVALNGRDVTLTLVVQSLGDARLMLHALAEPAVAKTDQVAISRWLEGLRRRAEERVPE